MGNVYGVDPSEVHTYIRTVQLHHIPASEEKITEWIGREVQAEGPAPSRFSREGPFPSRRNRRSVHAEVPGKPFDSSRLECLTAVCLYLTLFSSVWFFKVYSTTGYCHRMARLNYHGSRDRWTSGSLRADMSRKSLLFIIYI